MEKIYLSRRNLLTLINKLDRVKSGGTSHCALIKGDTTHSKYPQTIDQIMVIAVEDKDYYIDREAGEVLSVDDPNFL